MNVPVLRNSSGLPQIRDVLSIVHPLWGEDYSSISQPTYIHFRMLGKAQSHAVCVARAGAQRGGNKAVSERFNGAWPGAIYGVREPEPQETPLSWAEVHVLRRVW